MNLSFHGFPFNITELGSVWGSARSNLCWKGTRMGQKLICWNFCGSGGHFSKKAWKSIRNWFLDASGVRGTLLEKNWKSVQNWFVDTSGVWKSTWPVIDICCKKSTFFPNRSLLRTLRGTAAPPRFFEVGCTVALQVFWDLSVFCNALWWSLLNSWLLGRLHPWANLEALLDLGRIECHVGWDSAGWAQT